MRPGRLADRADEHGAVRLIDLPLARARIVAPRLALVVGADVRAQRSCGCRLLVGEDARPRLVQEHGCSDFLDRGPVEQRDRRGQPGARDVPVQFRSAPRVLLGSQIAPQPLVGNPQPLLEVERLELVVRRGLSHGRFLKLAH